MTDEKQAEPRLIEDAGAAPRIVHVVPTPADFGAWLVSQAGALSEDFEVAV